MSYRMIAVSAAFALSALLPAQEGVKETHIEIHQGPPAGAVGVAAFAPQASTFQFIAAEPGLFGKTVTGAPYSGEGFTEIVRMLADGTRITNKHSKKVWRDGQGRTREEVTLTTVGPWSAPGTLPKLVTIIDPVSKTIYTLNEKDKTAWRKKMPDLNGMMAKVAAAGGGEVTGSTSTIVWQSEQKEVIKMRTTTSGEVPPAKTDVIMPRSPAGAGNVMYTIADRMGGDAGKEEPLGTQIIEGMKVEGKRTTNTIKAGEIGNDRELVSVTERWTSPELQTIVRMTMKDPQIGETTYKLTNLSRSEPAASLFQVPADYTVSDAKEQFRFERKIEAK